MGPFCIFRRCLNCFFMLGRVLVSGLLVPIFKTFKDNFPSFLAAAEDTAWVNLSQQLINLYGNKINSFQKSLFSDGSLYLQIEHFIGTPWMLGPLIFLLVGVLSLPVKMIPTEDHGEIKRFRDFFTSIYSCCIGYVLFFCRRMHWFIKIYKSYVKKDGCSQKNFLIIWSYLTKHFFI